MNKNKKASPRHSMTGGLLMLGILVTLMAVPMAVGYFTIVKAPAQSLHADATSVEKIAN